MSQVISQLDRIALSSGLPIATARARNDELSVRLERLKTEADEWANKLDVVTKEIFESLMHEKLDEIRRTFSEIPTVQAYVKGTRWELIDQLTSLFDRMGERDTWTTMTTPEVWQGQALGLDGRYMSSNVLALRRGASIRRFMAISVDQLGRDWANGLADMLRDAESTELRALGNRIVEVAGVTGADAEKRFTEGYRAKYRKLLSDYLTAWNRQILRYGLEGVVSPGLFDPLLGRATESFQRSGGLMMSVQVYEDIDSLRQARKENSVSLLSLQGEIFNVTTEMRGRLPRRSDRLVVKEVEPPVPNLFGLRIYRAQVPQMTSQRMIRFYDQVHRVKPKRWRAINIGPSLQELCKVVNFKLEI